MSVIRQTQRTGVTATLVAILLPLLLLIVGFTVDFAYMQLTQAELQSATDLAAKAASAALSDTGSTSAARTAGREIAELNLVAGEPLILEDSDFVFGSTVRPLVGKWTFTADGTPVNAVKVRGRRTDGSPGGAIPLFFTAVTGRDFSTAASATASFINTDICLVLDRSSSMKLAVTSTDTLLGGGPRSCSVPYADSRWVALSTAISQFAAQMNTTLAIEQVAVVTFASEYSACGTDVLAATVDHALSDDMAGVTSAMATLNSSVWFGMTETSKGMQLGLNQLTGSAARENAYKVMIVLTDGAYTDGVDPSTIAADARAEGIKVHTITFGAVPQDVIDSMQATAAAGGGDHYHAPDADTLERVFMHIAGSLTILTD